MGRRARLLRGYFSPFSRSVMTAKRLTSDPVPLVVGMAANSTSRTSRCLAEKNRMALAASMAEPPPKAITASGWKSSSSPTPAMTSSKSVSRPPLWAMRV